MIKIYAETIIHSVISIYSIQQLFTSLLEDIYDIRCITLQYIIEWTAYHYIKLMLVGLGRFND